MKKIVAFISVVVSSSAFAHPGHDLASGAMEGLLHPLTGIDHLLALVSAGALLASASPRLRWQALCALVGGLTFGAWCGLGGVHFPVNEWLLALSVMVAGVSLLRATMGGDTGVQSLLVAPSIAMFAATHGYAHGAEATGQAVAFVVGLLMSSSCIFVGAMGSARWLPRQRVIRAGLGAIAAVTGACVLTALAL